MNVFSYSKSCGPFKKFDAKCPASFAKSIVSSNARSPRIGTPSSVAKLNVKNTESVSPYMYSARVNTGPYLVSHTLFP